MSSRDKDRHRDSDRKHSRRSRSRSKERRRDRSRSPKQSKSSKRSESPVPRFKRRERKSGFDVPPPGGVVPGAPGLPGAPAVPALAPHAPTGFSDGPNIPAAIVGGVPGVAPPSQQATRHARRIYVGGLPPTANEQNIATFFSNALAAVGGTTAGPGPCVVNVYINYEKKFAFVELRTVEETSNAMALDGIMFEGVSVRVRRPTDYNPVAAAILGPSEPNPSLNVQAIGLQPGGSGMAGLMDAAERIFVGGLPYFLTEEQCRELLGSFGALKSFDLVKDRETGNSKGYGFVVYQDPNVTDVACAGLNGMRMGERVLTVRRATEQNQQTGNANLPMPPNPLMEGGPPTRIVQLTEAVTPEELANNEEYQDILEDMRDECGKYGQVVNLIIPRPGPPEVPPPSGLGKVVIEYPDTESAAKARAAMHNRRFAGRTVTAKYLDEGQFAAGNLD